MGEREGESSQRSWLPWVLLPVVLGWIAVTVLRETPVFWRNEGGYPIGFRALVHDGYYPATATLVFVCLVGLVGVVQRAQRLSRACVVAWFVVVGCLGLGLAMAGANNIINLIESRPLHYHPDRR
jgi:hypothetical protein